MALDSVGAGAPRLETNVELRLTTSLGHDREPPVVAQGLPKVLVALMMALLMALVVVFVMTRLVELVILAVEALQTLQAGLAELVVWVQRSDLPFARPEKAKPKVEEKKAAQVHRSYGSQLAVRQQDLLKHLQHVEQLIQAEVLGYAEGSALYVVDGSTYCKSS